MDVVNFCEIMAFRKYTVRYKGLYGWLIISKHFTFRGAYKARERLMAYILDTNYYAIFCGDNLI